MSEATLSTWDLLPSLGFQPDDTIACSDIRPALSLDFGNVELSASALLSPYSGEIVLFSGVMATARALAHIEFELPRQIESLNQCAAWIVWNLDQGSDGRVFKPLLPLKWIEEARLNRRLLPWVMSQAEYD